MSIILDGTNGFTGPQVNANIYISVGGTNSGNIGNIGATALTGRIVSAVDTGNPTIVEAALRRSDSTANIGASFYIGKQRGTLAAPAAVVSGDTLANEYKYGYDGANYQLSAGVISTVGGTVSAGIVPGALSFRTATTAGTLTEAFNINSAQLVTFSAGIVPSQTAGIIGTTTNNNANAGSVGELITSSVVASTASLSTGAPANVTSISLTAGDWEVFGSVGYAPAASTSITALLESANSTSATQAAFPNTAQDYMTATVPGAINIVKPIPTQRFSLASTTTIYLVATATFSVSTMTAGGAITARRYR